MNQMKMICGNMKTKIIPFDLETAKKIQTGMIEGAIKTKDGNLAKLLVTDLKSEQPIVAVVRCGSSEEVVTVSVDGCFYKSKWKSNFDLVLEVPDNEPQFKPFDKVLVRHPYKTELCVPENIWIPGIFQYKNTYFNLYFVSGKSYWDCIPYEGNEHLVGTTNKPKEE